MKLATVLCIVIVAGLASAHPADTYPDRFDNTNVPELVSNRRLLIAYINCILEVKGVKCTAEGRELKSHIKEALETGCQKCTETQRKWTHYVIQHLIKHERDYWDKLVTKFDPDHKYTDQYEKELNAAKAH